MPVLWYLTLAIFILVILVVLGIPLWKRARLLRTDPGFVTWAFASVAWIGYSLQGHTFWSLCLAGGCTCIAKLRADNLLSR